jgi:uncharacterized membrane protein
MTRLNFTLAFLAALGAGLSAGVLFAFSAFVMSALGQLPPAGGAAAMQAINTAVLRSVFLPVLLGTGLLCLVLAIMSVVRWRGPQSAWLLAGALAFLAALAITFAFNVPRNDALAAVAADSPDGARLWASYLVEWTAWNHVRSIAAVAATAAFIFALARFGGPAVHEG